MGKKKKKQTGTDSPKKAASRASSAPMANGSVRFAGFIIAFLGIMLITTKGAIVDTLLNVTAIFMMLWGLFLVSGNFKNLRKSQLKRNCYLNIFIGFVLMALGILLYFKGGIIKQWFILIAGILIGVYGLLMLIRFLCSGAGSKRKTTFGIIMGMLTLITGVLICLLYVGKIAGASGGICYYIFGGIATAVGCLEIIFY